MEERSRFFLLDERGERLAPPPAETARWSPRWRCGIDRAGVAGIPCRVSIFEVPLLSDSSSARDRKISKSLDRFLSNFKSLLFLLSSSVREKNRAKSFDLPRSELAYKGECPARRRWGVGTSSSRGAVLLENDVVRRHCRPAAASPSPVVPAGGEVAGRGGNELEPKPPPLVPLATAGEVETAAAAVDGRGLCMVLGLGLGLGDRRVTTRPGAVEGRPLPWPLWCCCCGVAGAASPAGARCWS